MVEGRLDEPKLNRGPFCDSTQPDPSIDRPNPRQLEKSKFLPSPKPVELTTPKIQVVDICINEILSKCKMLNCLRAQAAKLQMSDLIMQSSTII